MKTASTGGKVNSSKSEKGALVTLYGFTFRSAEDTSKILAHILIAKELIGTGNNAHLPTPLNDAAATSC